MRYPHILIGMYRIRRCSILSDDQFLIPHNPNNLELPFGQPHYPKNQEQTQYTKQGAAPTNPPPSSLPKQKTGQFSVDPGALRGCLYRDTYIQLGNRTSFWFHPTYIDYFTTTGFKWNGREWIPWRTDLDRIVSFQCT
jgi:hypothetical protein